MLTYEEKLNLARTLEPGDTWRHVKTGATVTFLGHESLRRLRLRHASGRETTKQDHYFAYDFEPIPVSTASPPAGAAPRSLRLSTLAPCPPALLEPLVGLHGTLQVRQVSELDTHALFLDDQLLVAHQKGELCHMLAESIVAAWAGNGEPGHALAQFDDILEAGGFGRHRDALEQVVVHAEAK